MKSSGLVPLGKMSLGLSSFTARPQYATSSPFLLWSGSASRERLRPVEAYPALKALRVSEAIPSGCSAACAGSSRSEYFSGSKPPRLSAGVGGGVEERVLLLFPDRGTVPANQFAASLVFRAWM